MTSSYLKMDAYTFNDAVIDAGGNLIVDCNGTIHSVLNDACNVSYVKIRVDLH